MRVIVLGNGNAGRYIFEYFNKVYRVKGLTREDFDAANPDISFFERNIKEDDIVINCVGVLKPKIQHVGVANTFKINGLFPNLIQHICESKNAQFFHICSDCVFDGKRGNYTEDDLPNATDVYAKSKAMVRNGNIIRTSFIGRHSGLLEWVMSNKGKTIDGFTNCKWNGVTAHELCHFIHKVIREKLFWNGVYHLHSPKTVTKYKLCKLINEEYDLNITIKRKKAKVIEGTVINGTLDRSLKCNNSIDYEVIDIERQLYELHYTDDGRFNK